jgi:hypothetical protein
MTAELADGWLPILFIPEKANDVWGSSLAKGNANRSSDLGPLEIAAGGMVAVGDATIDGRQVVSVDVLGRNAA